MSPSLVTAFLSGCLGVGVTLGVAIEGLERRSQLSLVRELRRHLTAQRAARHQWAAGTEEEVAGDHCTV